MIYGIIMYFCYVYEQSFDLLNIQDINIEYFSFYIFVCVYILICIYSDYLDI